MMRTATLAAALLILAIGTAAANPSGNNVVLNEVMVNPAGYYDGAEYIELYNPTASAINLSGWVLTGTEYDQLCGGEDRWQFPTGSSIPAGGYLIIAKDGGDGADGFYEIYGFYPDYEMFDSSAGFVELDNPFVTNLILLDQDPLHSDEIQLVGGRGYGIMCGGTSRADVVYLYTTATLTTLVDLVEYRDSAYCTTDPCTGDDGADDNSFPIIPYLENALGRNPSGTDTDNTDVDFTLQAPTPGEQNALNTPPWIRNLVYSPIPPNNSQPTTLSAYVTDDGGIDSVMVYYRVDSGSWARVVATHAPGDSLYSANVPVQANGAQVEYYMRAVDNSGAGMNYPAEGALDPYAYSVGYTTIYNVQFVPSGGNQSQLVGRAVNVRGIVTAGKTDYSYSYFFIHEGTGVFKGVKIYAPSYYGEMNVGDDVTICGTVSEYFGETEIELHFPTALVVHSTGNPTYGFTNVTTAQIAPANLDAERYEGQLVRVQNATVTQLPDTYGQWKVRDSSAVDAMVDDIGYYVYEPKLNDVLTELRGVLFYNYNEFKVEPRSDDDIIGPPRIFDVRYSPIPPTSASAVTVTADCVDNVGITSATLYYATNPAGPFTSAAMTPARAIYQRAIGPFSNGTRIYYYVQATDGTMTVRRPTAGSYSFYVGLLTIHDVQFVAPGGDASPLDTLAVNVEGVVTAEPGVYGDYEFYIQDGAGAFNGILVYDRTGSLSFQRGDRVVVCGKVQENFRETEIALHFAEAAALVSSGNDIPAATNLTTNQLQTVTTGEQYEGILVHAKNATVLAPDIGYGEWMISNGAAADTCRVDDEAAYDYVPVLNDNVYVLGVVKFSFGNYKIEPRGNPDIAVNPVGVPEEGANGRFGLFQNAPNPFNPKTTIAFTLPEAIDVKLDVFDVAGRRVTTLVDERLGAGEHRVEWNGLGATGDRVASGVYFYKLTAGEKNVSKKMVLLK